MPAAASITVAPPAAPVIRRLAPDLVKINGRRLGKRARLMRDGMQIEIGSVVLTYTTAAPPSEAATVLAAGVSAAEAPARLVDVKTGRTYELHRGEMVVGRGSPCDIVIEGTEISRRHARLTVSQRGTQLSVNGTRRTVGDDVPRHATRVLHWPGQGQRRAHQG